MSNLLQIIQDFAPRKGIRKPTSVVGSSDAQILQILALANKVLEDLRTNYIWEIATYETSFTTVATESQGNIRTIAPNGFLWVFGGTIYNRTLRLPVYGPITNRQWQALKALPAVGPYYKFRIRGDELLFNPVPTAGQSCYFEYQSSWLVSNSSGSTKKASFTADTDLFLLDDSLMKLGLEYQWRYEKGLDYAQEFSDYQLRCKQFSAMDAVKPVLDLSADATDFRPGIFVPSGNWPVVG